MPRRSAPGRTMWPRWWNEILLLESNVGSSIRRGERRDLEVTAASSSSGLPSLLLLCPDRGSPGPRRRRQLGSEGMPAASAAPQRRHGLEVTAASSSLGWQRCFGV